MYRYNIIFFAVLLLLLNCKTVFSEEKTFVRKYNVGYKILDFKYLKDKEEKKLTVAVWYPTEAKTEKHIYGGKTTGDIAADGKLLSAKGPFPLLLFSHGYGGGGLGSVFMTEYLASRGWIVVAPDHHDNHSAVRIRTGNSKDFNGWKFLREAKKIAASTPLDRKKYLYRLDEFKLALNEILKSPEFGKSIDKERIAVGGHSFGGYTSLGLCGTVKEYYDPRIKAILLYSTGAGGYLYSEKELKNVKIPSLYFYGENEKEKGRGDRKMSELVDKVFNNIGKPKFLIEIKDGNHFSFNNRFKETWGAKRMSGSEKEFEIIRSYSIDFLEKFVADSKKSKEFKLKEGPMISDSKKERETEKVKKNGE